MRKFHLAALLALGAAAIPAQPLAAAQAEPAARLDPVVDSAERRQELRTLATCLAERRPGWARRTLSQPYLSERQRYIASEALTGTDRCIGGRNDTEVTFRTSSVVANLAEHYLQTELRRADFARVTRALATLAPRNASEDFALCVTARNPAAARDLTLSEFGSRAETAAADQLAAYVGRCTMPGENLTVDMQALRALSAIALYRGVTSAQGTN